MSRRIAVFLALALIAGSCGRSDGGELSPIGESSDGPEIGAPASPPATPEEAPAAVPLLTYRLELVNRTGSPVRVFASAGAGRVALDTIAPGDSGRLKLRVAARSVRLEAMDPTGRTLAETELALHPDSLHRWEIGG